MKTIDFFSVLCLITLFAACTTQVETNLPEPEMTQTEATDGEVELRSTIGECDSLENDYLPIFTPTELADLMECRLNQGVKESSVIANCTFSEQYSFERCFYESQITGNYNFVRSRCISEVVDNTDDCPPCGPEHSDIYGCRTIIFTVTYLSDDCPGAPDELEYSITADVYCCY